MAKIIGYEYEVVGTGVFPLDMLRYDCAHPADSHAVDMISVCHHDREDCYGKPRRAKLASHREPTIGRWNSFGWSVPEVKPIRR